MEERRMEGGKQSKEMNEGDGVKEKEEEDVKD
jgi:hypothetical protein